MTTVCQHGSLARSCQVCELEQELAQEREERDHFAEQLGLVYWHVTNGKLSKPYDFKAVESVIDDELNADMERYAAEQTADLRERAEAAEAQLSILQNLFQQEQDWRAADTAVLNRRIEDMKAENERLREALHAAWESRGNRAHQIGCECGGVNERTDLSCAQTWALVRAALSPSPQQPVCNCHLAERLEMASGVLPNEWVTHAHWCNVSSAQQPEQKETI